MTPLGRNEDVTNGGSAWRDVCTVIACSLYNTRQASHRHPLVVDDLLERVLLSVALDLEKA